MLQVLELEGGEVIGYEGKLAEAFYIVQKGSVVLTHERYVDGEEYDEEVGRLSTSACFGEHQRHAQCPPLPACIPCIRCAPLTSMHCAWGGATGEHALDYIPKEERNSNSLATIPASADGGDGKQKMLRLASGALIAAPNQSSGGGGGKGAMKKGLGRKTEAPPIWRDTVLTDPQMPRHVLLWMSREHFVEVLGHLKEVLVKNEILKQIEATTVFQDLRPDQRLKIADAINRRHIVHKNAGDLIYAQGDEGAQSKNTMYAIWKGSVKLVRDSTIATSPTGSPTDHRTSHDEEGTTTELAAGATFGVECLVTEAPREATARAAEPSEIITISRDMITKLLGSIAVIADGQTARLNLEARRKKASTYKLPDLQTITKLGSGAFGEVSLVELTPTLDPEPDPNPKHNSDPDPDPDPGEPRRAQADW